jgi:hypothetical protein
MAKKIFVMLVALIGFAFCANAQITKEERDKLNDNQKKIYDTQQKEIDDNHKKAEDLRYLEKEANKADFENREVWEKPDKNYHLGNKARELDTEADKNQKLLDNAARKAIENNEKKKNEKEGDESDN